MLYVYLSIFLGLLDGFCHLALSCVHGVTSLCGQSEFLFPSTIVPIIPETQILDRLCGRVGEMTGEEKIIPWLDAPC